MNIDEKEFDAIFTDRDQSHRPGIAAGIAVNGRTVYRKAFGLASMELPVVLSPTMRMRIGSITKQMAALAYLRLCEEGRCSVGDTIGTHLPEVHPKVRKVTMMQLMGNNSGLREALDLCYQFSGRDHGQVSALDLISFYCENSEMNAEPGTRHQYNNGNWILLSVAMERITRMSLEEVMWTRVFKPIGMYDTMLRRRDADCIPNVATCHALNAQGKYERLEQQGGLDIAGAGHVVSTVDDMLRWLANMGDHKVGSVKTWELMKTPQLLRNGTSTSYGCGLSNKRCQGIEILHHGGGGVGSNANMIKVPHLGLDIIVMTNGSDTWSPAYSDKILKLFVPGFEPLAENEPYQGPFPTGVFRSTSTGRAIALGRGDTGYYLAGREVPIAAIDGHFYPFAPDSEGVLRPTSELYGDFEIHPKGDLLEPSAVTFVEYGAVDEMIRVPKSEGPVPVQIEGRYWSAETGTVATIKRGADGHHEVHFAGRFGGTVHGLENLADEVWRSRVRTRFILPRWGCLLFSGNRGFAFYNACNSNVRFVRD